MFQLQTVHVALVYRLLVINASVLEDLNILALTKLVMVFIILADVVHQQSLEHLVVEHVSTAVVHHLLTGAHGIIQVELVKVNRRKINESTI